MAWEKTDIRYADNLSNLSKAQAGDEEALAWLMETNAGLVRGLALRFRGRGVETEDLIQIGSIGMLKAIRSFDTERGTAFSTYAVPLIIGEIRRFLRDDGLIKIGRRQKKLGASLLSAREKYMAEHGSEPQLHELAAEFGVSDADAALALDAISPVHSMSQSIGDEDNEFSLEDLLQAEDEIERRTDQMALRQVLDGLPELWRKIIFYRYFRDYSQQNTADMLGLTQVKISREEKKIFAYLREELLR
ncbi:MAG: sigma-70 family RNA polymerase sigma factor [Ruminococcaceae bacterium]|nr:sigma-70 family RNA polymerase sigma factor [Oscillospiraceae bacterium]